MTIEVWILVVLIAVVYAWLILWLYTGIYRIPEFVRTEVSPKTRFSIIIPFRDEAENLPSLLQSIAQLDYPKHQFEVWGVNDASSDHSVALIQDFLLNNPHLPITIIENQRQSASPKKDAILSAIKQCRFDWILTTDADCLLPKNWLQIYDDFIQKKKPVFIAGLVSYKEQKGFLYQFQQFDWMSLVGVTLGSFGWQKPLMCSGANLAYSKYAFLAIDGFKGNDQIASGDDVFLLHKMEQAYPEHVYFLKAKEAMVRTSSVSSWPELWQQRIRWAAKTGKIPSKRLAYTGIVVFVTNLTLILLAVRVFVVKETFLLLSIFFLSKLIFDTLLVRKLARVLDQKISTLAWFLSSIVYPFFSTAVAITSFFLPYSWKGRRFRK